MKLLLKSFLLLLLFTLSSNGVMYYVDLNATGQNTGLSWSNAWTNLPSINWTVIRAGDIIEVSKGNYIGGINVGKSGTQPSPITIRLATEAERRGHVYFTGGELVIIHIVGLLWMVL